MKGCLARHEVVPTLHLTLYIGVGELRCIIGPNGAGKTTLMDVIMAQRTGLEPATPGVTGRYSNRLNYRCA